MFEDKCNQETINRNRLCYRVKKKLETDEKYCRKWGSKTFEKLNLVRQISAVAAFEPFKLVVTCLVIVAGL